MTAAEAAGTGLRAGIRNRFGVALACVFATYVGAFLIDRTGPGTIVLAGIVAVATLGALATTTAGPRPIVAVLVVDGAALVLTAVGVITHNGAADGIGAVLLAVALGFVSLMILRDVLLTREVEFATILGAISVYAALGLMFTVAYWAVARLEPGPFFEQTATPSGSDFVFFSFTTLTTTGYGDLSPAGHLGRMVVGIEMMTGQIFLVTLVAGLVALWRPGSRLAKRQGREGD